MRKPRELVQSKEVNRRRRKATKGENADGWADEQGYVIHEQGFSEQYRNLLPKHRPVFPPKIKRP
jgi:hypothetical protein